MQKLKRSAQADLFAEKVKNSAGIDTRYAVLDFNATPDYLNITTDSLSNAMHVSSLYQKTSQDFRIKILLLPDRSASRLRKGICHVGVAPVRRYPSPSAEQITQVLFGESFETLQIKEDWIRVRLHADGYVGWVSDNQVTLLDDRSFYDYQALKKVYAAGNVVEILSKPSESAVPLREAVLGSPLSVTGEKGSFLSVRLPDGTGGWVSRLNVAGSNRRGEFSVARLLDTARMFLGISYEWGGRSPRGFDCSGFVQTVFGSNGIKIPRDADLQYLAGAAVGKNPDRLRAGDLLFFSSDRPKISHVAIYTGKNREFIHCSGFVRINSLDRKSKNFSRKLSSTIVGACRVI